MASKTAKELGAEPAYPDAHGQANYTGGLTKREVIAKDVVVGGIEGISVTQARAVMNEMPPKWPDLQSGGDHSQCLQCVRWWATAEARLRLLYADTLLYALSKEADDGR